MIRRATHEDIDACLLMARRFFNESGVVEVGYSQDQMRETLTRLIDSPAESVYQRSGYRPSERSYMKAL